MSDAAITRIQLERSQEPLPDPDNHAAMARRRLFRGHNITAAEVFMTPGHFFREVSELRKYGYVFERDGQGPTTRIRMINPEAEPRTRDTSPPKYRRMKNTPLLRAVLAGESMTSGEAGRRFQIRPDALRLLVARMEGRGYTFHKFGSPLVFQMATAPDDPTRTKVMPSGPVPAVQATEPQPAPPPVPALPEAPQEAPTPEPQRVNGILRALAPHPSLDSQVRVHMLAVTDDGDIQVGIKNDAGQSWLLTVEGYHSPP